MTDGIDTVRKHRQKCGIPQLSINKSSNGSTYLVVEFVVWECSCQSNTLQRISEQNIPTVVVER